jgi:hypothetical protein
MKGRGKGEKRKEWHEKYQSKRGRNIKLIRNLFA